MRDVSGGHGGKKTRRVQRACAFRSSSLPAMPSASPWRRLSARSEGTFGWDGESQRGSRDGDVEGERKDDAARCKRSWNVVWQP